MKEATTMETSTGEIIAKLKNICDKLEAGRQHHDADTLREAIAYMTDVSVAAELLRHSRASQALFDMMTGPVPNEANQ